jgi:hypothetical protein
VRETFGALIARYQSEKASDLALRTDLTQLAEEEIEHAQWSHDVQRWLMPQLSPLGQRVLSRQEIAVRHPLLMGKFAQEPDRKQRVGKGSSGSSVAFRKRVYPANAPKCVSGNVHIGLPADHPFGDDRAHFGYQVSDCVFCWRNVAGPEDPARPISKCSGAWLFAQQADSVPEAHRYPKESGYRLQSRVAPKFLRRLRARARRLRHLHQPLAPNHRLSPNHPCSSGQASSRVRVDLQRRLPEPG